MVLDKIEHYRNSVHGIYTLDGKKFSFTSMIVQKDSGDYLLISTVGNAETAHYKVYKGQEGNCPGRMSQLARRILFELSKKINIERV